VSPVDLSSYDKRGYRVGAGVLKRVAWYVVNAVVFQSWLCPLSAPKRALLRLFGASVGAHVVIKPRVNIKYPWFLHIGSNSWIGENAWIDNLAQVTIGDNVCISQEAYLLTGNHDYKDPRFGLMVAPVSVRDGAWIGARAVVCPGVSIGEGSVLTAGSVAQRNTDAMRIYRGNPAQICRERHMNGKNKTAENAPPSCEGGS
jgi:putative colanic acid biosynthesis acetyltransferase WcaF